MTNEKKSQKKSSSAPNVGTDAIAKNIETIHKLRQSADENRRWDHKWLHRIAAFAGSPNSLYGHVVFYTGYLFFYRSSDSLSAIASIEAIFLAIFVLVNQRHMNSVERRNSDLQLQTTLLIEQELTALARVIDRIAKQSGLGHTDVKDLVDAKKDVSPSDVLEKISEHEKKSPTDLTSDD